MYRIAVIVCVLLLCPISNSIEKAQDKRAVPIQTTPNSSTSVVCNADPMTSSDDCGSAARDFREEVRARLAAQDQYVAFRIDDFKFALALVLTIFTGFAGLLGWVGFTSVRKWTRDVVVSTVKESLTRDFLAQQIKEQAGSAMDQLVSEYRVNAESALKAINEKHREIERLTQQLAADSTNRRSRTQQAAQLDVDSIRAKPMDERTSDDWYSLAFNSFYKDDALRALEQISEALAVGVNDNYLILKARILSGLNRKDEAVAIVDELISRVGRTPWLLRTKASILSSSSDKLDDAEALLTEALNSAPQDISNVLGLASFLDFRRSQKEAALALLEQHKSIVMGSANAIVELAELKQETGAPISEVLELLENAIKLAPNDAVVAHRHARMLALAEKSAAAEKEYKRAIELDPDYDYAITGYAKFLAEQGQHDRADSFFKMSIETSPNDVFALISYARFLLSFKKDVKRARVYFDRAKACDVSDEYKIGAWDTWSEIAP